MSDTPICGPRGQAYSLVKVAEAIEEASSISRSSTRDVADQSFRSSSSHREKIQQEQQAMLTLPKRSIKDIAPSVSRDSSEIPFDERSVSSYSSGSHKLSPTVEDETRDNEEEEYRICSTDSDRSAPPPSITSPNMDDTTAQQLQTAGPYANPRPICDHQQQESTNLRPLILSFESSWSELSTDIEKTSARLPPAESLRVTVMSKDTLQSSNSDDIIDKLRDVAESTFDDHCNSEASNAANTEAKSRVSSTNTSFTTEKTAKTKNTISSPSSLEEEDSLNSSIISYLDKLPRSHEVESQSQKSRLWNRNSRRATKHAKPDGTRNTNDSETGQIGSQVDRWEEQSIGERSAHSLIKDALLSLKRASQHGDKPEELLKELTRIAALHTKSTPQKDTSQGESMAKDDVSPNEASYRSNSLKGRTISLVRTNEQPLTHNELQQQYGPEPSITLEAHARLTEPRKAPHYNPELAACIKPRSVSASRALQLDTSIEPELAFKHQDLRQPNHNPSQVPTCAQQSASASQGLEPGQLDGESIASQLQEHTKMSASIRPEEQSRSQEAREHWKDRLRLERYINRSLSPSHRMFNLGSSHSSQAETLTPPQSQLSEDAHSTSTLTDEKKHADLNEKMLQECYSAIISLKRTSESKYEALESKYLELKGSFSYLETNSRPRDNQKSLTPDNRESKGLETKHPELKNSIAQIEAMNFKHADGNRDKESRHQALEESLVQLETQNRQLREVLGNDDTYRKLRDSIMRLEEQNSQLRFELQLTEKLQAHCQTMEERCALLQSGLSELETQNVNLRNENIGLTTKLQTLEDQCHVLETATDEMKADKKLMMYEKDNLHARYSALEAICQRLEESNSVLEAHVRHSTKEKESAQSKVQALQAQNMTLEEFNKDLQAQCDLLHEERDMYQSKVQVVVSKLRAFERSRDGFQADLQEANSRCLALEELNADIKVRNQNLECEVDGYQSKLQDLESDCVKLKESYEQLMDQNLQLQTQNQHLKTKLNEAESSLAVLAKSNADLSAEKCQHEQCCNDLKSDHANLKQSIIDLKTENAKLEQSIESLKIELEQSIENLKTENARLETENESLNDMQTKLEENLEKATREVQELCTVKAILSTNQQSQNDSQTELQAISYESPEENVVCFISHSSSNSSELRFDVNAADSPSRLGYEVISSQEIQSFHATFNPPSTNVVEERDVDSSNAKGRCGNKTLEEQMQEKLSQLSSYASESSDREGQFVESLEEFAPTELLSTVCSKTRENSSESAASGKQSIPGTTGKKQSQCLSQSRSLPPLSPRPAIRPPLPPVVSTPQPSKSRGEVDDRQDASLEASSSESDSSDALATSVQNRSATPSFPRRSKREQSPSSILQELLQEHHRGVGKISLEKSSSAQDTPRSPKSSAEADDALSPGMRNMERSRKSKERGGIFTSPGTREAHHIEQGQRRSPSPSPSPSPERATLFGLYAYEEPKVILEDDSANEPPQYGAMVLHMTNSRGEMPMFPPVVEPTFSKTQRNRKCNVTEEACEKAASESTTEDETNSIVTQSTTRTQDLLNTPSATSADRKTEEKLDFTIKTEQKSGCGDCFVPFGFDSSRRDTEHPTSKPERLPVAIRPNVRVRCDETGCGVDFDSCSSILARRTWNYGKKQSQAVSRHLLISKSEHSSVVSITTSPTGVTTVVAGVARAANTAHQGDGTSSESNSSDNGLLCMAHTSSLRAKRAKLRRKQGHNFVQTASSSGSSQSDMGTPKQDMKASTKPTTVFPFLF